MNFISMYPHSAMLPDSLLNRDVAIVECPFTDFDSTTSEALAVPFEALESLKEPTVIVALPYSITSGSGKGYALELIDYAGSLGYNASQFCKVPWSYYGSCIDNTSAFLLLSRKPLTPPKTLSLIRTTVKMVLPEIITFAPKYMDKVLFVSGTGAINGFLKASSEQLPAIRLWNKVPLLCERQQENSLQISRILPSELNTLFGLIKHTPDLFLLESVVPVVVYDTFCKNLL